jgi:hypothetical protein
VKQRIPPAVAVLIVVVVVAVIGWFGWSRSSGPRMSRAEEEKWFKPLDMPKGQTATPNAGGPGPGVQAGPPMDPSALGAAMQRARGSGGR